MSASAIFLRHHALRWVVPVSAAGVLSLAAGGVFSAQASANLPNRTPAQLLADLDSSHVDTLSGTIVAHANLGLPELPNVDTSSSGSGSLLGLLTGSHTVRIWVSGPDKQRVALLETVGETDVFRNGRNVWQWSSSSKTATHVVLPAGDKSHTPLPTPTQTLTPQQVAERALAAMSPSTVVTTAANKRVADRSAYELVLSPRDAGSRVGSVHIAIDGQHKIPLGVQVYARGDTSTPAIDISFTQISFAKPADVNFTYTPPAGVHVTQENLGKLGAGDHHGMPAHPAGEAPALIGKGWTTIAEAHVGDLLRGAPGQPGSGNVAAGALQDMTTPVHGSWGSGRLFQSKLLTALLTNDGRVFVGAVDPQALYTAAATHK